MLITKNHSEAEVIDLFSEISPEIDKNIMTIRQSIEQRGVQKGVQKGIQKGIMDTAKNLLKMNSDISFIKKATGLSQKQIEDLKRKKSEVEC